MAQDVVKPLLPDRDLRTEREDMAAAFRWVERLDMNEAVATISAWL